MTMGKLKGKHCLGQVLSLCPGAACRPLSSTPLAVALSSALTWWPRRCPSSSIHLRQAGYYQAVM
uniref:Uncharacterized protein n=1 Tax=Rhizophora mucronata TaxID=61149 RepID=A0A2P2NRJ3_RHIMU